MPRSASLRVNQASIQVLSANIAHVNDPNYTKKTLNRQIPGAGRDADRQRRHRLLFDRRQ